MSQRRTVVGILPVALGAFGFVVALGTHPAPARAQGEAPPADVRAVIEGTWELVEWHVGDQVLRPPEMEGRWMVHDGLVMATRHRNGPDDFESTAGYGEYRWGPMTWTYGYERSEDLHGPSPDAVELTVTGSDPIRMRTFHISRDGAGARRRDAALGVRRARAHVPAQDERGPADPEVPQGGAVARARRVVASTRLSSDAPDPSAAAALDNSARRPRARSGPRCVSIWCSLGIDATR